MQRKTLALYLILSLVLLGLIAAGAYSLGQYARLREERRMVERQLVLEIQSLLQQCRDRIQRHPDYELRGERLYLSGFAQASPADQLRRFGELKGFCTELEEKLIALSAGIGPQDEGWAEALRYKTYSPNGFNELYEQLDYPGAEPITAAPPITGDPEADRRIVELAERRGYRVRWQADEQVLEAVGSYLLQEAAARAWEEMKAAAAREGIQLELVSAYRSLERQRQIFLKELGWSAAEAAGGPVTAQTIASGSADRRIEEVLRYSSIPGFSKHHSGYAIDISDPSEGHAFTEFAQSPGFAWISGRNYLNAKRFGFIPSYPPGAEGRGPDPESWEYVWVGRDRLLQQPATENLQGGQMRNQQAPERQ